MKRIVVIIVLFLASLMLSACNINTLRQEVSIKTGTIKLPQNWECVLEDDGLLYIYDENKQLLMSECNGDTYSNLYYKDIKVGDYKKSAVFSNSMSWGVIEVEYDGEKSDKLFMDTLNSQHGKQSFIRLIVWSSDITEDQVESIASTYTRYGE